MRLLFFYVSAALLLFQTVPATPTIVDTVLVPVKIIRLGSITAQQGSDTVYEYSGQVYYDLRIGSQDSLTVALDFIPAAGGAPVTPYEITGDAGIRSAVNGINGRNVVAFKCRITGKPALQYTARITLTGDTSRIEKITDSLYRLMTDQERIDQLHGTGTRSSADLARLGIPGYYMSNGPSGVCHGATGTASAFPTGAAMGCTFDTGIIKQLGGALAKEFYAKGKYILEGPMQNLVRDPRGGRNWETFSEDPYLSARISVAYCQGVQSLGCVVMPKHFIANDMEALRSLYSSEISERTLREIYCMPFEYAVKEGKAWSVMSSYNKINGLYACDNKHVLTDILKDGWGFRGFVCSDWNSVKSTADAANAGQDIEMPGSSFFATGLLNSVTLGQVSRARFEDMVKRILRAKVWAGVIGKLGEAAVVKYGSDLKSEAHKQLALEIARKSIVVVKNEKFGSETVPALPLDKSKTVSLIGPYAGISRFNGSGSGRNCPYYDVSPLQGVINKVSAAKVVDSAQWRTADIVIVCLGVSGEGEGSERTTATLEPPAGQLSLVNAVLAANKKCVVVLTGGSAAVQESWANAPAIVVAWYPGEEQGNALADILYGDVNPSGRLSSTWPASVGQLPPFTSAGNIVQYEGPDTGRGYRYYDRMNLTPLYCFGHGLSYTTFEYSNLRIGPNPGFVGEDITVTVDIRNTGSLAGEEVAQLYISESAPKLSRPIKELRGFARITLEPGEKKAVSFVLREREFAYWDPAVNAFVAQPDAYTIKVGPSSKVLPLTGTLTLESPW
ncbi:MAG: glycoside hydrolase family 3 C-terminal domain-containing protein [Chitinispirillaceae bacterium]|nr:glycoside hydrolase family 3 C-terminal domain-containing protein [Chitinispirillaceae bacterium]